MATSIAARGRYAAFRMRPVTALLYLLLVAGAVVMIWPFLWMLFTSIKPRSEIFVYPPVILPQQITFENWLNVLDRVPLFPRYFLNSAVMSAGIIVGRLIVVCLAAYSFARLEFPGRNLIFMLFLTALMVPQQTLIVPLYLQVSSLGWLNSYHGLIVPSLVDAFGIFMLRQFFLGIPHELEDAATIDGCNLLQILVRIYIALSVPALTTLALFSFIDGWNAFLWPLIVSTRAEWRTVEVGLSILSQSERMDWGLLMAASVISVLPVLLFFVFVQRRLVTGISLAGVRH